MAEQLCDSLEMVASDLRRTPGPVVHGDLHLDNVLFEKNGGGRQPVVLDWGSVCTGLSAIDVFPFVAMSLSPQDHTRYAADLIADLPQNSAPLDDGRRRLLCYFAGVIGWRNRPPARTLAKKPYVRQPSAMAALSTP
jgi:Ser/Thr protein kinase RdoA (MazF antagonist)